MDQVMKMLGQFGQFEDNPLLQDNPELAKLKNMETGLYACFIILLVMYLGGFITSAAAIHGARVGSSGPLKIWVIWNFLAILLMIAHLVVRAVGWKVQVEDVAGTAIGIILNIYFILCVNAHRVELQ